MNRQSFTISTISSLIISILTGAIPHFQPLNTIYQFLFNKPLPTYLLLGFSTIGTFTLYYTLFSILILLPFTCYIGGSLYQFNNSVNLLHKPSKEDIVYLILLYSTYLYICYVNHYLTSHTALVGVFAIFLPFLYRAVVYSVDMLLEKYHSKCLYPLYLFTCSFFISIPVTIFYLYILHILKVV